MYKILLFIFLLTFSAGATIAQTSTADSVKIAIGALFIAMRNSDSKAVLNCFADSAIMQTIARDKNGEALIKTEKLYEFATVMASMPKGAADERITFDIVKVDGPLAIVWTPYKFYYNGQFSHCGVNSFQLVRLNGQWKIQYIIDTRRKQDCN